MPHPRSPRRRLTRPVVATAEILALGLTAHAGVGGTLPSADRLVLLAAAIGVISLTLHHRLLNVRVAALLAVGAQVALHAAASSPGAHATHAAHLDAGAVTEPGSMLLGHTISAAVTVLALVWQEQAVLAVVRRLEPLSTARPVAHRPPVDRAPRRVIRCAALLDVSPHRGPPTTLASALA